MKKLKYLLFALFEMLMITVIVVLMLKLRDLYNGKVKGAQHLAVIKKEDIVLNNEGRLKYFYEPKPNHKQVHSPDWLGYEAVNTINSDGLNERKEYSLEKSPLTYRIITLGDSFTFGMYVNTEESYPKVLEKMLNDKIVCKDIKQFEVINLGVPGYDIEYSVERFIKRGVKYKPDLVFWLLNNWNFQTINELTFLLKEKFSSQSLKDFDPKTGEFEIAKAANLELKNKYGEDYILNYQKGALAHFFSYYKGRVVNASTPALMSQYEQTVKELLNNNYKNTGIYYFSGVFDTFNNDNFHLQDKHPSREGHKKIAESIFNFLHKQFLKQCKPYLK